MLGSVRLTCGLLFPGGKLFDVLCLGCCFISVWCLLPVLSNVKQHIFCDISETFTSAASLVSQSVARKALMLSGVKWCIWSGRLACLQATDPCSGAGKVPAVVFCCPLSLICLSLPGIHLLLSHRAQQRTPSCTLHKAQLLNKRRLQAGGIPAAGVSQRRQKRKHVNASFWGTRGRWRGRAEKRTGLINRVHRWRSDDLLAWEWMSPWGCWCLDQTHSVQTDPQFQRKSLLSVFYPQRDRISLSATNASLLWCEHSSLSFTPTVLVLNGLHIDTVPPTGCECITSATSAVQLSCVHTAWWLSDVIKGAQPCVWG